MSHNDDSPSTQTTTNNTGKYINESEPERAHGIGLVNHPLQADRVQSEVFLQEIEWVYRFRSQQHTVAGGRKKHHFYVSLNIKKKCLNI